MIYAAMPRMIYSLREYDIPRERGMIYYPRLAVADNIEKSTAFAVLFSTLFGITELYCASHS